MARGTKLKIRMLLDKELGADMAEAKVKADAMETKVAIIEGQVAKLIKPEVIL